MTNEVPSVSRPVRRRLRKGVLPPGKISIARALSKKARNQHSTPKKVVKKKQSVVKRISASLFTLNEEGSRVYFLSDDEALSNRDARRNQKKKFGTYSDPTQQTGTLEYVGVFFFDYYRDQNEHPVFGETHGIVPFTWISDCGRYVSFPKESVLEDDFQDWTPEQYGRFPVVNPRSWIERDIAFFVFDIISSRLDKARLWLLQTQAGIVTPATPTLNPLDKRRKFAKRMAYTFRAIQKIAIDSPFDVSGIVAEESFQDEEEGNTKKIREIGMNMNIPFPEDVQSPELNQDSSGKTFMELRPVPQDILGLQTHARPVTPVPFLAAGKVITARKSSPALPPSAEAGNSSTQGIPAEERSESSGKRRGRSNSLSSVDVHGLDGSEDEDNGSYAAFSKRLARMEEEQGLIAERQKQMLRMIEDLHRKQTGKKTPETDGNALEKYKIDYLPIKVEPGKEAEGITKLVALETKLSDPEFKRALENYCSYHIKNSYGVKSQFTHLLDILFHPSLIPFITWSHGPVHRNELCAAPNICDLIRAVIPHSEITSVKDNKEKSGKKRSSRAPMCEDEPYFKSKIKDWRNNTMNTKKNKACEAALAVNKLITKGQGGPVFPILLKRQRNSSDDENSDDEAVASTN